MKTIIASSSASCTHAYTPTRHKFRFGYEDTKGIRFIEKNMSQRDYEITMGKYVRSSPVAFDHAHSPNSMQPDPFGSIGDYRDVSGIFGALYGLPSYHSHHHQPCAAQI